MAGSCLAIAAGDKHSAAVLASSKKLYVWGEGNNGQLGLSRNPHVPVSHLSSLLALQNQFEVA